MPSAFASNDLLRATALGLAGFAAFLAIFLVTGGGRILIHDLMYAQSSPSISISLSPSRSVPLNTELGMPTCTGS